MSSDIASRIKWDLELAQADEIRAGYEVEKVLSEVIRLILLRRIDIDDIRRRLAMTSTSSLP